MLALLRLELHAERFFERGANGTERGQIAGAFDTGAGVTGIRGEEKGDIFRIVQRRGMKEDALEIFGKTLAEFVGGFARLGGGLPESIFVRGEVEGFEPNGSAVIAAVQEQEAAVVC